MYCPQAIAQKRQKTEAKAFSLVCGMKDGLTEAKKSRGSGVKGRGSVLLQSNTLTTRFTTATKRDILHPLQTHIYHRSHTNQAASPIMHYILFNLKPLFCGLYDASQLHFNHSLNYLSIIKSPIY